MKMDEFTFENIIEELNRQTQNLDVGAINENYGKMSQIHFSLVLAI